MTEKMDDGAPQSEPEFFFNGEKWPNATMQRTKLGATEIWRLQNDTEMDHPFHLHGTFFQQLGSNNAAVGNKGHHLRAEAVFSRCGSDVRRPGRLDVPHCRILEHAERGMMGMVMVSP
jgi:FtsP/CotA-like multicopper oxidase with cupredoxin domain